MARPDAHQQNLINQFSPPQFITTPPSRGRSKSAFSRKAPPDAPNEIRTGDKSCDSRAFPGVTGYARDLSRRPQRRSPPGPWSALRVFEATTARAPPGTRRGVRRVDATGRLPGWRRGRVRGDPRHGLRPGERRSPPGPGLRPGASMRPAPRSPTGCSCRTAGEPPLRSPTRSAAISAGTRQAVRLVDAPGRLPGWRRERVRGDPRHGLRPGERRSPPGHGLRPGASRRAAAPPARPRHGLRPGERRSPPGHGEPSGASTFEATSAAVSDPVSGDLHRTTVCTPSLRSDQRRGLRRMQLPHRRRVPGLRGDLSGDLRRDTASRPARRRPEATRAAVSDPVSGDLRRDTASRPARQHPGPAPRVAAGAGSRRPAPRSPTR